ncbi:hypothetical protein QBC35DRAFT_380472 [Podospora australis]|uniref:Tudor domain-containing protein n=1 Tax=Podospora australis TaxID=1536484 RepID=A0AAN6WY22_9PEZI|nr:hypothetical protein QBC35DRAFT_380472 [Podospora australis]
MSAQQFEEEKKEYESQLELVIASLKDDADNSELLTLKSDLEGMIQILNDSIAELKPVALAPKQRAPSPPPAQKEEKWSRENHPAFKKPAPTPPPPPPAAEPEEETIINYQVNDTVMAKWMTGDRGFYPARITSVTGSKTAPIYTVKFKSYDTVETLRAKDIKPMNTSSAAGQKRKAVDSAPPPPPPTATTGSPYGTPVGPPAVHSGIVVAAAAEKYPQATLDQDDDKPKPKFKKIKANKELEAGKNKWQEFTTKGKFGKAVKKDSMFRTPEGVKGRVGFTGSGQAMRKDVTRTRHIYQPNEDLD